MRRAGLFILPLLACTSGTPQPAPSQATPEPEPERAPEPSGTDRPSPPKAKASGLEGPFTLEVRSVNGASFRYQFIANHMGSYWWVQADGADLRLLEGSMTEQELSDLTASLSPEFFELDALYVEKGMHDGSQVTMRLTNGGRSHRVVADNKTPPAMAAIQARVSAIMTFERRAEVPNAPMAQPEDLDPTLVY